MSENERKMADVQAVLYSAVTPTPEQNVRLAAFLMKKYGQKVLLTWKEDPKQKNGFLLKVKTTVDGRILEEVYDWSLSGRKKQLEKMIVQFSQEQENVIPLLKDAVEQWKPETKAEEIGSVMTVGDGIATVSGLSGASYGEILLFSDGIRGMVQDLKPDSIGCILFGDDEQISEGSSVWRTGRSAGIPAGDAFIGRVIDALGNPIDGGGKISADTYMPVETPAPEIIDRQPVDTPMETGLLAIDSMFPIGRGQRELIIGDRQTGKTAIALDTILNQKGKDVICIYVAIGQKASSVAQLTETLRRRGAMDYSIVVCATASDSAPLQYIAPYAGCAMGEYFMNRGKDVLIVYDDLSKHAIAYRSMSLLLERSPGREAYPGDVFYLHSRLLERAAHLSDERGGGSMTALPIVETQAGDVSAYIPTNIISITDGQIFLESDLFFAGQRPAVNVGLSVSRVGGAAQTKAMKAAAGAIRLDLAQYREMEVFTQFASDLDDATKRQLVYGQGLMQLLKQAQYHPMSQHEQVLLLVAALAHKMQDVPPKEIPQYSKGFLKYVEENAEDLCRFIDRNGRLELESRERILRLADEYLRQYNKRKAQ